MATQHDDASAAARDAHGNESRPPERYRFHVDDQAFVWEHATILGFEIKALAAFDPTLQLMLEGRGGHPDRPVADDDTIDLSHPGAEHFYGAPSATYGARSPALA